MAFGTIRPKDLHEKMAAGQILDLVDVRTPTEYAAGHIVEARSIPLSRVTTEAVRSGRPEGATGPTYVICHSGARSRQACHRLMEAGLTDVVNVEGGTAAWRAAGLPVEPPALPARGGLPGWARGAGLLLVFVCLVLSWQVQPWFAYIALGVWVLMLIGGRGACPLNSCAIPTPRQSEKVDQSQ